MSDDQAPAPPTRLDRLRAHVLASDQEWTTARACDVLGWEITRERARELLNRLAEEGLLSKHGKRGALWTKPEAPAPLPEIDGIKCVSMAKGVPHARHGWKWGPVERGCPGVPESPAPAPRASAAPSAPDATGPEGEAGDVAQRAGEGRTELRDRIEERLRDHRANQTRNYCVCGASLYIRDGGWDRHLADVAMAEVWPFIKGLQAEFEKQIHNTAGEAAAHRFCAMNEGGLIRRAERAEAAVEQVQALHDHWQTNCMEPQTRRLMDELGAALDPPATPTGEDGT